jgi:hypothetical protein
VRKVDRFPVFIAERKKPTPFGMLVSGEAIGSVSLICYGELVLQIARGRHKCDPDRIYAVVPCDSAVGKHLQRLVGRTYPVPNIGLYDKRA